MFLPNFHINSIPQVEPSLYIKNYNKAYYFFDKFCRYSFIHKFLDFADRIFLKFDTVTILQKNCFFLRNKKNLNVNKIPIYTTISLETFCPIRTKISNVEQERQDFG